MRLATRYAFYFITNKSFSFFNCEKYNNGRSYSTTKDRACSFLKLISYYNMSINSEVIDSHVKKYRIYNGISQLQP
jgi:hypothetical protein